MERSDYQQLAKKAYFEILLRCDEEHVLFIKSVAEYDSVKALNALGARYEESKLAILQRCFLMRHKTGSIEAHINSLRSCYNKLKAKGLDLPEIVKVAHLLSSCSDVFPNSLSKMSEVPENDLTFEDAASGMLVQQRWANIWNTNTAASTNPVEAHEHKNRRKCHYCGRNNHLSGDCYNRPANMNHKPFAIAEAMCKTKRSQEKTMYQSFPKSSHHSATFPSSSSLGSSNQHSTQSDPDSDAESCSELNDEFFEQIDQSFQVIDNKGRKGSLQFPKVRITGELGLSSKSSSSCDEQQITLMVVYPPSYPKRIIRDTDFKNFQNQLNHEILKSNPKDINFGDVSSTQGCILITCNNEQTASWLQLAVHRCGSGRLLCDHAENLKSMLLPAFIISIPAMDAEFKLVKQLYRHSLNSQDWVYVRTIPSRFQYQIPRPQNNNTRFLFLASYDLKGKIGNWISLHNQQNNVKLHNEMILEYLPSGPPASIHFLRGIQQHKSFKKHPLGK